MYLPADRLHLRRCQLRPQRDRDVLGHHRIARPGHDLHDPLVLRGQSPEPIPSARAGTSRTAAAPGVTTGRSDYNVRRGRRPQRRSHETCPCQTISC